MQAGKTQSSSGRLTFYFLWTSFKFRYSISEKKEAVLLTHTHRHIYMMSGFSFIEKECGKLWLTASATIQSTGYDINDLYKEAQSRWLKPAEVLFILQNYEKYQLTQQPVQQPTSNIIFDLVEFILFIENANNPIL